MPPETFTKGHDMDKTDRREFLRSMGVSHIPGVDHCESGGIPVDNSHASQLEGYWDGHAASERAQKIDDGASSWERA